MSKVIFFLHRQSLRKVNQAIGYHITPSIYPEIEVKEFGDRKTIQVKFAGSRYPYLAYNIPRIRVADEDLVMDQMTYEDMIRQRNNVDYSWKRKKSKYNIMIIIYSLHRCGGVSCSIFGIIGSEFCFNRYHDNARSSFFMSLGCTC